VTDGLAYYSDGGAPPPAAGGPASNQAPDTPSPPLGNASPLWWRAWHPVAHAEDLPAEGPAQVLIGGQPWVVARLDGRLVAFADQCPHRLAPLSAGSVKRAADGSARLACAYHGWQYDAAGQCDLIPALGRSGNVSKRARLRPAHGVTEAYGLIWLAPEEPLSPLPAFPEWDDPAMTRARSRTARTQASAGQLVDNFLDAAHFPFVHAASFGVADDGPLAAGEVTSYGAGDGWLVTGVFDTPYRDGGTVVSHRVIKSAGVSGSAHVRLELPGVTIGILLACQPEDHAATRVYKLITRSDVAGDAGRLDAFIKEEDQILAEDLAILERYPSPLLPLDPRAEVHSRADRLSVAWRRLLAGAAARVQADAEGAAAAPASAVAAGA
jgi:phenylpropionate dioxygenase-like ring-hydroxylating dioxygenase large terminal subunit